MHGAACHQCQFRLWYETESDGQDISRFDLAATLALAWPQDARSPAVAAFVRTACTVAAAHARAEPVMQSVTSCQTALLLAWRMRR